MGKIEEKNRIRVRNTKIARAILTTLAVGVAGSLNPRGLIRAVLKELKVPKEKRRLRESAIYTARKRLAKQGLIEYTEGFWKITEGGKKVFSRITTSSAGLPRPKKWDKKWRILIFDIRENKRGLRDKVRRTLVAIGFVKLQYSVWVYPYDCEDYIALLKSEFKVGKELVYVIADAIENDGWIIKKFGLAY